MNLETVLALDILPFFDHIKSIRYGYQDICGKLHDADDADFAVHDYIFSSPEEVISNSCGWCWDVANLIALYCRRHHIEHITVFMEYHTPDLHQTHTQVFLKWNKLWYPAPDNSAAFSFGAGRHENYESCRELFTDSFRDYLKFVLKDRYDEGLLLVKPVTVPIPAHISDDDYLTLVKNC